MFLQLDLEPVVMALVLVRNIHSVRLSIIERFRFGF